MATPAPQHIAVGKRALMQWLELNFDGWHHTKRNNLDVTKTTIAMIPNYAKSNSACSRTISDAIIRTKAKRIGAQRKESDDLAEYIHMLHNRGMTLQTRPDHMVLTRQLCFLVKSQSVGHVATLCSLKDYACLTEAHQTAEASLLRDIQERINRLDNDRAAHGTVARILKRKGGGVASIYEMFETINKCGYRAPVGLFVNVMLGAAAMLTGITDAGAKFRDRTARTEAARHYGESIASLLVMPLKRI